jgi:hypothetical protein
MTARLPRLTVRVAVTTLVTLLLAACIAPAQIGRRGPFPQQGEDLGLAASWAYSGDDTGYRLELATSDYVIDAGVFNAENYGPRGDGDVYALELGVGPGAFMEGYEGVPFVAGVGAYRFQADDPEVDDDDSFSFWFGTGDFTHDKSGLFYQYRFILDGPIEGSQGIVGWAF